MREIKWPRKGKDKREQNVWLISKRRKKNLYLFYLFIGRFCDRLNVCFERKSKIE